jgi:hypothetical protein
VRRGLEPNAEQLGVSGVAYLSLVEVDRKVQGDGPYQVKFGDVKLDLKAGRPGD